MKSKLQVLEQNIVTYPTGHVGNPAFNPVEFDGFIKQIGITQASRQWKYLPWLSLPSNGG